MTLVADLMPALRPLVANEVYRDDQVPEDAQLPRITILDEVSVVPAVMGNKRAIANRHLAQVDVWQDRLAEADADYALHLRVVAAIDGLTLTSGRTHLHVDSWVRVPEEGGALTHHAITVSHGRTVQPVPG